MQFPQAHTCTWQDRQQTNLNTDLTSLAHARLNNCDYYYITSMMEYTKERILNSGKIWQELNLPFRPKRHVFKFGAFGDSGYYTLCIYLWVAGFNIGSF